MSKRLLDLFCGAGGASVGYRRAGYSEIVGVDSKHQRRYPFTFVQADALAYLKGLLAEDPFPFDAIHASPPCQRFSSLRHTTTNEHPDLIEPTRELLQQAGVPYVIENVPGAPLDFSVMLCGSMFGLGAVSGDGVRCATTWRQLRRHRLFELSFPMLQPLCQHDGSEALGVYGHGTAVSRRDEQGKPIGRRGGYQGCLHEAQAAMEISWMTTREIAQAIPPAYTEFIALQMPAARGCMVGAPHIATG